jgi:FAD/FMN-containing dehydrogenase
MATNEGGVVIDLSSLHEVEVLDGGIVRIGGGAIWGDVAAALQPHDLALTSGDTTTVGVGGLTLGGGIGWLVRQYGLALDNLVSAEVVTATGELLHASADSEPELFWALRGGGGNFGVVTTFTFQAHPLKGVFSGSIVFGDEELETTLTGYRDVMRSAPEQLNATFVVFPSFGPEMPGGTSILVVYAGDDEQSATAAIEPLLRLKGVVSSDIKPMAYVDVLDEPMHPDGPPPTIVDNNGFTPELTDEAISTLASVHRGLGGAVLMIRSLGGALNRVDRDATAFGWRDSEFLLISAAFLPPGAPAEDIQRIRDLWAAMAPFVSGSYGNFMSGWDDATIAVMFPPETRAKLESIKHRYDPQNLFRRNQNIVPRGAVGA